MMEAVRTSETSVDNYFTRQYIPEDNSEHHTRRRENLKSHVSASVRRHNPNSTEGTGFTFRATRRDFLWESVNIARMRCATYPGPCAVRIHNSDTETLFIF
jgi:hypothetical protein